MPTQASGRQTKYRVLAGHLRTEIDAGRWGAGDQLPGANDLARRFNVAYMTARQAVESLVADGVLVRIRGKGTFVAANGRDRDSSLQTMALLFPTGWLPIDPYYLPELIEGFSEAAKGYGYRPAMVDYDETDNPGRL